MAIFPRVVPALPASLRFFVSGVSLQWTRAAGDGSIHEGVRFLAPDRDLDAARMDLEKMVLERIRGSVVMYDTLRIR